MTFTEDIMGKLILYNINKVLQKSINQIFIASKCLHTFIDHSFRDKGWNWMDLRKNSKQMWLAGGFPMNDHELQNSGPKEVHSTDYVDMTPLGNKLEFSPSFASNATDEEKSGKQMLCRFPKYIPHLTRQL